MIKAAPDGLWLGTELRTCFLAGTEPDKWEIAKEVHYGVVAWAVTPDPVAAWTLSLDKLNITGEGYLWLSNKGICWGGPAGQLVNFTERNIDPRPLSGKFGAAFQQRGRVVFSIEP